MVGYLGDLALLRNALAKRITAAGTLKDKLDQCEKPSDIQAKPFVLCM